MYQSHFGLSKPPFGLTPDTSFFFTCITYQEALNTLLLAVGNGEGFIKITGEVGNGKTMLCRKFLALLTNKYVAVNISRPCLDSFHLLQVLAEEFAIPLPVDVDRHQLLKLITNKLLEYAKFNQHAVVCLDEAQILSLECLETLRLLTNNETENRQLLQVVLFGQPELDEHLADKSMRQFRQRITFQHHLGGLLENELEHYLNHRLNVAGYHGGRVFTNAAIRLMYRMTDGNPRLVNIIAHKSLLLVFGEGSREVLPLHVRQAAIDTPEAKFSWLAGKANKFAVICQNGGQRSIAVGLINKVLIDFEKRGGVQGNLGQVSAYLRAAPSHLRASKVPILVPIILFLLVASAIWGMMNAPFRSASKVQLEKDATTQIVKNTDSPIVSTPEKFSAHALHDVELLESKTQNLSYSEKITDQLISKATSFQIVPPVKPLRFLAVSGSPMLENEDVFQIVPARKPRIITKVADETLIGAIQADDDLFIDDEDLAVVEEPIVVASIAESTVGLLSTSPDQQETVAMIRPVESMFNDKIIKQVNIQQQAESKFQQAILFMQQGRINEALEKFNQVLQLDATHEAARQAMVGLLMENRRFDEVEILLREGIRINPGQTAFAKILSRIQVEKGNIEAAIETLQHSLPQALNQPDYRAFIGALLQRQHRHKEAIEHYRVAVNLSPNTGVWLMGLGISLQEEGHFSEAHEIFRRAQMSRDLNEELQAFVDQRVRQTKRRIF